MIYSHFFSWRTTILRSDLEPNTRLVLLTLACHMNDAGESCYPSIDTLTHETGLSNRVIIKHLKIAKQRGWITVEKHGFKGQRWARNDYKMAWPNFINQTESECNETQKPVTQDHCLHEKAVTLTTEGGDVDDKKAVTQRHTNYSVNSSINSTERQLPENLDIETWNRWIDFRKKMKYPAYKTTAAAKNLARYNFSTQKVAVDYSINNEYRGLFPENFKRGRYDKAHNQTSLIERSKHKIQEWLREQEAKSEIDGEFMETDDRVIRL